MVGFHPGHQSGIQDASCNNLECTVSYIIQSISDLNGYQYHIENLNDLLKKHKQQNLYLAVVGQVKRGKSTLINAIIGEEILPFSIIPVTAIPTFLKYAESLMANIVFLDSKKQKFVASDAQQMRDFLSQYIVEEKNPENKLKVSYVEVFLPADVLKEGIVLIDTPGIGSTYLHNTETTLNFLPKCDAALFVTSVDPPVTEVEIDFLKRLSSHMKEIYFILNKIDYLSEKELAVSEKFFRDVLKKNGFDTEIFLISAKMAFTGKKEKDKEMVEKSRIEKIEKFITSVIARNKKQMIEESLRNKLDNIVSDILTTMEIEIKSLNMPVKELEGKLNFLREQFAGFEREKNMILDSLEGDRNRLHQDLEEYSEEIRKKSKAYFEAIIKENLAKSQDALEFYQMTKQAISSAIDVFFEYENGVAVRTFEKKIKEISDFYSDRINQMVKNIREVVASAFEIDIQKEKKIFEFEIAHQPYWVSHVWMTSFQPFSEDFVDMFLPSSVRMKKVMMRLQSQLEELLMQNIENLRWSIFQSIDRFFIKFKNFFEKYFSMLIGSTSTFIEDLLKEKQQQKFIDEKVKMLEQKKFSLLEIKKNLIKNRI